MHSQRTLSEQKKRYANKQRRGKKTEDQVKKHGEGYASGRFSAAQTQTRGSSSESDDEIEPIMPQHNISPPIPVETDDEACPLCGWTKENGIVGIGIGILLDASDIQWVQCKSCTSWYHMECLGMESEDVGPDDDWFCDVCTVINDD